MLTWEGFDLAGWQLDEDTNAKRLVLDVAVHLGTLLAVMTFFWRDVGQMGLGLVKLSVGRNDRGARLAFFLLIASVPLFIAGFLLKDFVTVTLRDHTVIAWATIGFGLLLYLGDRIGMTLHRVEHMTVGSALVIGVAQALALVPGTSRSGITITAARFLGFERQEAARFSLLLAIPAILGAGSLAGWDLYRLGSADLTLNALVASGLAFLAGLVAIAAMMAWLRRATFTPFVAYRIWLGLVLLWLIYQDSTRAWLGF